MSHRKSVPSYCLHKPSGQAVVYIDRKPHYLGVHDSADSRRAYGELLARLAVDDRATEATKPAAEKPVTIAELCLRFVTDELPRYSRTEQYCQRTAIRVLRNLLGETSVADFGPLRLRVVRDAMVNGDPNAKPARKPWSRDTANRQTKRIQQLFRWGVSWQIVPESVATSLATVRILAAGETKAKESVPRRAVSKADFDAVAAELRPRARDILTLLSLTGQGPEN